MNANDILTLDRAVALLAQCGDRAKSLAADQSAMPDDKGTIKTRFHSAVDKLEIGYLKLMDAHKPTPAPAPARVAAPAPVPVKETLLQKVAHVFSPVNVAAVKSAPAVPPVLPAKTHSAPVKRAPAATPSPLFVQKPASVPQIMSRTPPARRRTAGM
jgi:hypothetical protein